MNQLENKVAIVTGATAGIGRQCALTLAAAGAKIIATGRKASEGEKTVELIKQAGGEALFLQQDVTNEKRWQEIVATAAEKWGRLDILVNNAGGFFVKPITDTSVEDFQFLNVVNVDGVFLGMKYVMPLMDKQKGGSIINVSSLMGQVGLPMAAAYCASKGAVISLTKGVALEAARDQRNIRVNAVVPGVIQTDMILGFTGGDDAITQGLIEDTPLRDIGRPEDIANCVLFFASDDSKFVTGAAYTVDGGRGCD